MKTSNYYYYAAVTTFVCYLTNKEAQAVYYTVIKHDRHLRTRGKCRKHEPQASVFYRHIYISSNAIESFRLAKSKIQYLHVNIVLSEIYYTLFSHLLTLFIVNFSFHMQFGNYSNLVALRKQCKQNTVSKHNCMVNFPSVCEVST